MIAIFLLGLLTIVSAVSDSPSVQLSKANDDFGLLMLHRLELAERHIRGTQHTEPQNLFISPFSINTVMSMLMAGSDNVTYAEIRETLS